MNQDRTPTSQALQQWRTAVVPVDEQRKEAQRNRTLSHIEREISRPVLASRRRGKWALLAAALLAGVVGLLLVLPRWVPQASKSAASAHLVIAQAEGTVVVTRGGRASVASAAQQLSEGDEIATATVSGARLGLPGGKLAGPGEVVVGAHSELRLDEVRELSQRLRLAAGRIDVKLAGAVPGRSLVVTTPHADIAVVGTRFSVEVDGLEGRSVRTRLAVQHGVVRVVRTHGASVFVHAGQTWTSDGEAPGRVEHGLPGEAAGLDASSSGMAPASSASAEPGRGLAEGSPQGRAAGAVAAGSGTPGALREAAERTGGPERGTLAEENRLYRSALDARNAGDDARAVAVLEELLARYPASPLAQEAEVERFRALGRLGRRAEAARAARRYLAEHGAGFAREEAQTLVLSPSAASARPGPQQAAP